jgi:hypothetical protein
LRTANELDLRRVGGVADEERSLLRVEWKVGLTRSDESNLLNDMLGRIGRMENTTREIRGLISALPAQSAPAAVATAKSDSSHATLSIPSSLNLPEADLGANMAIKLGALAAAVMLLLMLFWRRRQANMVELASAPVPKPLAPPVKATPKVKTIPVPSPASAVPATGKPSGRKRPEEAAPTFAVPATPAADVETNPDTAAPSAPAADGNPEQALELANIMLSMGLTSSATQTLVEHIRTNPRDALFHWLKLLEIYRTSGHRSDFKEAAEQLRQHFNIQAEDWNKVSVKEMPTLEKYERVVERLQTIWTDAEASSNFLRDLLEDNRGGTREGFPQPVAEEILFLIALQKHKQTAV